MPDYRYSAPSPLTGAMLADLAADGRFDRLANYEDISHLFTPEEENRIVDYIRACFEMSYQSVSKRYPEWRLADRAHDVYVPPETTRFREKAVISDTRAVADTLVTYMMSALTGRNPMFQLEADDRDARRPAAILERELHKHMRKTNGEARVAQMVLDAVRYGFAPTSVTWSQSSRTNQIGNFDPRRAFPDPRVSFNQTERMQFFGFSDWSSFDAMRQSGLYPKLDMFPALRDVAPGTSAGWPCNQFHREQGRGWTISPQTRNNNSTNFFRLGGSRVVNEMWLCLAGWQLGVPQINDIWLLATVMDEKVVIRFHLNPYGRLIPATCASIYSDFHRTYAQSAYDLLLPLHDIATWLMRSRIDNVQAALNNLIFVDPTKIAVNDLINRNPWGIVRTLPGGDIKDGFFVAPVPDVTRDHWSDIAQLSELKQRVSAATDARQGMPTAGIRSATEIQRLTMLGSQRLGTLSRTMSANHVRPVVNMMVSNLQDAIEYSGSIRIDPHNTPGLLAVEAQDGYIDFNVSDLQGPVDYMVVDGTLPSEPSRDPQSWISTLEIMSKVGLGQEYKLGLIAEEAIRAFGIYDIDKFRISPEERQRGPSPSQQLELMEKLRGASVQPTEDVMRQVERGNLIPQNEGARQ